MIDHKNDFERNSVVSNYFRIPRFGSLVLRYHIVKEED